MATAVLFVAGCTGEQQDTPGQSVGEPGNSAQAPEDSGYADLVERVEPSVVTVRTSADGIGSGVVLRDNIVITNQHVVTDQRQVTLTYADGTESGATVLATDRVTDLAVLRTERGGLPVPEFREQLPRPGERAVAIGSPLGFENSVTAGIVSGLHREIPGSAAQSRSLVDLIQTDASISPGNSGGALLDAEGRVIGINEAYIPPSAGAVSLGFAIPTSTVLDTTAELLEDGTATHPYLGLSLGRLTESIRQQLGIQTREGALVVGVERGSPAADAGLRRGDVLVRFGDAGIGSVEELLTALRRSEPGQRVPVEYVRDNQRQQTTITIGSREG
ncbi:S1-C subfamily serine protease [Saccharomonospora amisosensis]|uniref:S1-C subfamily serine protease n=1 Tax=Saccharomonospora amisosensis TaxID=1128677 RepID=A0A7X5UT54_9PSEU|nr:trypsin-like peptidase domain-containing protein [Saccharomonospora amisosensis]NIJ13776.1 S1-C subfamily serine protease [Saccharomonospora amisosensis]